MVVVTFNFAAKVQKNFESALAQTCLFEPFHDKRTQIERK
jgi:hypothetical protein